MEIQIRVARAGDKELFKNLLNAYHNELGIYCSEFQDVDDNGYFDVHAADAYFSNDKSVLPFIITADDRNIGFAVVTIPPYTYDGSDFCLQEFFIVGFYRGKGVAELAAKKIISLFPGRFCAAALKNDSHATNFLRNTFSHFNGTEKDFDQNFILFEGVCSENTNETQSDTPEKE